MKIFFLFIFLFSDFGIIFGNECLFKAESFLPEDSYFQKAPFYFLKNVPSSIKLFSGTDLSFFRDQSIVSRYRYRLDIPVGNATAIDRSITRWSPWLSFDFIEILIPVLDLEGGYKLLIEYQKNKSDEILKFERVFYVYRLIAAYSAEPVKSPDVPPTLEKKVETSGSVQKTSDKNTGLGMTFPKDENIPVKALKTRNFISLEKLTLNTTKIDLLRLNSKGIDRPISGVNISLPGHLGNIDHVEEPPLALETENHSDKAGIGESLNEPYFNNLLKEAFESKNEKMVKNSILKGAGRDFRGVDGGNVFHLLSDSTADDEVIKVLISNGISLNATDDRGNSPLHLAILNSQNNYARLLINIGADLDSKNKLELSPLHLASILDNRPIAGELITYGAEVDIYGNTGYTPLHIASELNHLDLAGDLLSMGANPKLKTFQGLKAKEIAKIQKSREMSRLIGGSFEVLSDASESNSSQAISYLRTARLNPKYEFMLPYDNNLVKKRQFNKTLGMISIPVLFLSSSGAALLKSKANNYYSLYQNAETIDIARQNYDKTLKYDRFTYISGGVSLISAYGILHSFIRKKSLNNSMYKLLY